MPRENLHGYTPEVEGAGIYPSRARQKSARNAPVDHGTHVLFRLDLPIDFSKATQIQQLTSFVSSTVPRPLAGCAARPRCRKFRASSFPPAFV